MAGWPPPNPWPIQSPEPLFSPVSPPTTIPEVIQTIIYNRMWMRKLRVSAEEHEEMVIATGTMTIPTQNFAANSGGTGLPPVTAAGVQTTDTVSFSYDSTASLAVSTGWGAIVIRASAGNGNIQFVATNVSSTARTPSADCLLRWIVIR